MKIIFTLSLGLTLLASTSLAQPLMTNGVVKLDFDGDESQDVEYLAGANKINETPEQWNAGVSLDPFRSTRLLRSSVQRISFDHGAQIDGSRTIYKEVFNIDGVPVETYTLVILDYRATLNEVWEYITISQAFENESDLLIGVKVVVDTGTHYGWIHLTRPVIDKHTPFELVAYTYHPVPLEPIRAGEPPGLPAIHTEVGAEELTFSWDSRWGNLILESAESLESPEWEEVIVSAGGPVAIPVTAETQRFYRLRTP